MTCSRLRGGWSQRRPLHHRRASAPTVSRSRTFRCGRSATPCMQSYFRRPTPKSPRISLHICGQIVRASRQFMGHEWVSYDMSFRRMAANQGSLDWGVPNPGLYNDAYTGAVKSRANCFYCLDAHSLEDCPEAPETHPPPASCQPAEQRQGRLTPRQGSNVVEICRQFNGVRGCRFSRSRYAHLCERCHGPHPAIECGDRRQPMGQSRSPPAGRQWDPKQPR